MGDYSEREREKGDFASHTDVGRRPFVIQLDTEVSYKQISDRLTYVELATVILWYPTQLLLIFGYDLSKLTNIIKAN